MKALFERDRYRLLLVEDSPEQRRLVRVLLEEIDSISFEIVEASRLSEALTCLAGREFDLALVDLSLPDAQGLTAVSRLKSSNIAVPLVVLTGLDDEMTAINAIREGAEDYLVKDNVTSPVLKRVILHALQRHWVGQALSTSQERMLESQKIEALGRMASGIVHDFNNLLSGIMGFSEILMHELKDSPLQTEVSEILRAGERASELTKQILAFSRRDQLIAEPICVNEVISSFQKMLSRLMPSNVTLEVNLAETLPSVMIERSQMEQIIMNLVVNARDAMEDGGRIKISTEFAAPPIHERIPVGLEEVAEHVCIRVSDTGCGMTPELQKNIFDPFFTTKPTGQGSGLGLSTVYGIVRTVGGRIEVESALDKGSTFVIYLPAAERGATAGEEIEKAQHRLLLEELQRAGPIVSDSAPTGLAVAPVLARQGTAVKPPDSTSSKSRVKKQLEHLEYVLSHDLQEPVRMVNSYLSLLSRRLSDDLTDETTEFLELACDGGLRLQQMIQGILRLSRLNRAECRGKEASTERMFEVLRNRFDTDRLVWKGEHGTLAIDQAHLLELATELVDNGFKFQLPDSRGEVVVSLETNPDDIRLVVENEGVGIPEGELSRCLELFGRLHARDEFEGVGFGLCYCHNIMDKYGGSLRLSRLPTGARVECIFRKF